MARSQPAGPKTNWIDEPSNVTLRHARWWRLLVSINTTVSSGTTDSKAKTRRVSQRPGQVYSRIKQVTAVTVGTCQTDWNLTQASLAAKSSAAYSIVEPAAHSAAK